FDRRSPGQCAETEIRRFAKTGIYRSPGPFFRSPRREEGDWRDYDRIRLLTSAATDFTGRSGPVHRLDAIFSYVGIARRLSEDPAARKTWRRSAQTIRGRPKAPGNDRC